MIDSGLYAYEKEGTIRITSTKKGKRLRIKLKDKNIYNKNLRIKIVDKRLEIHKPLEIKTKRNTNTNIIGINKGLNDLLNQETERLNDKNKNRNRLHALYKTYLEEGKTSINHIREQSRKKEIPAT